MSRALLVVAGICVVGMIAGCATNEEKKAEAAKVQPVPTAAKTGPAAEPKPTVQYVDTPTGRYMVHDENRPAPPIITPGGRRSSPPSDAIVLFDGTEESLKNWTDGKFTDGKPNPVKWQLVDGCMESVKGGGFAQTTLEFGSCQLHVEFATPSNVQGSGQGRGNSGVFLQGQYEVQVLDSYENKTYPDGQCGALYGRAVPLVNVCRKPGEWQAYDIVYHRPFFDKNGKVTRKATFTIFQNGVVIQDHVTLEGGTDWINAHTVSEYKAHGDKGPIRLQDHGNPVRYRNIWIRELTD